MCCFSTKGDPDKCQVLLQTAGSSTHGRICRVSVISQPSRIIMDNKRWVAGERYEGEFENGKFSGYGTQIAPDGFKCEGQHKKGRPQMHGLFTLSGSIRFVGQFGNGQLKDPGALTLPDGRRVVGNFEDWQMKDDPPPFIYGKQDNEAGENTEKPSQK